MDTQDKENIQKEIHRNKDPQKDNTQNKDPQKDNTKNENSQNKQTDNPHDKGYKRIFSIKKHFLHFIKKYIALERATGFQPLCPSYCITVSGTGLPRASSAR